MEKDKARNPESKPWNLEFKIWNFSFQGVLRPGEPGFSPQITQALARDEASELSQVLGAGQH
jgi:hypothetical protein